MSAAVWDAEKGGATAAVAAAAAAEGSAENWEPASQAGIGGGVDSAGGSGYPETKDNGEDAAANLFGNDIPDEDGGTGGDGPAIVIASIPPAAADGVVGRGGGLGTRGSAAGTAFASGTSTLTKRRNSMAFEIARVERAGKAVLANPEKAKRAWELSRPRFVEESSVHGPAMGGSGGGGGGREGKTRARLPPGQENRNAVPYGVWSTSWAQMGDFGLDVGMYFVTLAQLVGAVLVYAALCVVAMVHFSSENYSGQQAGVRADLRGSAVCTASKEVLAFPRDSWDFRDTFDRNDCPLDSKQGYADMAGVLLLFMLLLLLGKAQEKAAEYTATQIHSAQPYTVKVSSPDPLADDPERWRRLFAQFGHVSYVTVARGNGALLRAMANRRAVGRRLESSTPDVAEIVEAYRSVDTKEPPTSGAGGWWKAFLRPCGFSRDTKFWARELWDAHRQVEGEIMKGMHDQGLPVVKVFVTFESDLSQARCLSHMSRGILDAPEEQHMYTNPDGFKTALHVMPASPASEVLYENLHIGAIHRIAAQVLTFVLTTMIVIISFLAARELEAIGVVATALVITVVDVVLPPLVRLICSVEKHHNSVSHDLSVMNKLTLARWANLAGIPFWLNDRLGTLTESNLELVVTVLWLNAFVPTFIRLLDIRGRWSRSVLAKKEVLQAAMDSHLEGSRFHLSDRYTDTTKTVFACLAYAPVLPIAMWIGLLSLSLSYWSDKWLFVKAWRTPQPPGNSGRVARLARRHLALAVLAHCVFALYYYAGWPFDRICRFDQGWIECSQEGTGLIEAETQSWMTGPQKTLVDVFSALNVAWLVILLVFYYLQSIMRGISLVVKGAPRKLRSRQHMPFSQLTSRYQHDVDAYVPQIKSSHQPLPLLACDLDFVEPETIPWQVDGHKGDSFEDYCLSSSRDMPRTSRYQRARLFSLCVHYPPPAPFEAIGNGRVSKTDIDWFRRPPHPGLQETKIPEMGEASRRQQQQPPPQQQQQQQQQRGLRQHGNDDAVDMGSMPGLVDQDYASQHPQSQAPLDSNGPPQSIYRSSVASAEGERVPMLPGGAQSSLVSTAIVAADAMRVRGTPGGEEDDDGSGGVGGGGGSSAGKTMDASAEGAAAEGGFGDGDMVSGGVSDRSGRSTRQRSRDQGDHASDIHPGEGADEYAIRRSGSGNRPTRFSNGMANGTGGVGGAGGAAATAANGGSGGARGEGGEEEEEDMDIPELATPRDGEDGDMSFYDGNSRLEEEVVDNFADIPTPAPRGAGGRGSGAVAGADGRTFRTQRSNSSEGWVDQYTSSSLVVSKAAPSASSQQQQQQAAAAEAARGGAS